MSLSLFDISQEFYVLSDLIDNDLEVNEETGEITDNSEVLKQLFDELKLSFEDKLDNSKRYLLALEGEADILSKEIKRLQAKKAAINNKAERLEKIMLNAMVVAGIDKIKTPLYNFSIRKSESVEIIDLDSIPRNFLRVKYEADKNKIKAEIKNGKEFTWAKINENKSLGVK